MRLIFTGEPLSNRWVRECAFYISKLSNVKVLEVVTNNSINPKHYLSGFDLKKTSFSCSFHYEHITFQKFLKNVRILKNNGCHVYVNMVCVPHILKYIPKIIKIFKKYEIVLKLQAFQTRDISYIRKKYPNSYTNKERNILKKYFICKEEFDFFIESKCTKGLMCYAGVDTFSLSLDGTIKRCFTGQVYDYYQSGGVKNKFGGTIRKYIPNKLRAKINATTNHGVLRYLSRKIKSINNETHIDDLISGKIKLPNKAFPCHENNCFSTSHLIGLKHIREKFLLSENFVGMYKLKQII